MHQGVRRSRWLPVGAGRPGMVRACAADPSVCCSRAHQLEKVLAQVRARHACPRAQALSCVAAVSRYCAEAVPRPTWHRLLKSHLDRYTSHALRSESLTTMYDV